MTLRMSLFFSLVLLCVLGFRAAAQNTPDTLHLDLQTAEQMFYKNNFLLLAEQYKVSAQDALITQARLWQNPVFSGELNAITPSENKYFNIGSNGQKAFAIEQLFAIGGRKSHEVDIAIQNKELAMLQLEDLSRELLFQIRKSYHAISFTTATLNNYTQQIELLEGLVKGFKTEAGKGNVPLIQQLRLEAALYKLRNDKNELRNSIIEQQQTLQTLIGTTAPIAVLPTPFTTYYSTLVPALDSLVHIAMASRADMQQSQESIKLAEASLSLQKALAIPDVTLGASYDQSGGAYANQVNLTFSIPLPLIDRNQGNVQAAKEQLSVAELSAKNKEVELRNEVTAVYKKLMQAREDFNAVDTTYLGNFDSLNRGIIENFQKRNISLVEFVDLFESYNDSIHDINQLEMKLTQLYDEINYVCGKKVL